ncbi:hypothetical protein DMENIID0001_038790 [Sergentomyia squamirostris]
MGAPSTGAESLQCCGRDGGHQQHGQVPQAEANNNQPLALNEHHQQEDQRNNNNELINNNHIYLNPYFESFSHTIGYTFIDETLTTLPITQATNTPNSNRSFLSTDLSFSTTTRDINSNAGSIEPIRCNRAKDQIRLFKEKFVRNKQRHANATNSHPGDFCGVVGQKQKSVKVKSKNKIPAGRMRGSSGRGGDSDPLMRRPRRRIADKSPKKQPLDQNTELCCFKKKSTSLAIKLHSKCIFQCVSSHGEKAFAITLKHSKYQMHQCLIELLPLAQS